MLRSQQKYSTSSSIFVLVAVDYTSLAKTVPYGQVTGDVNDTLLPHTLYRALNDLSFPGWLTVGPSLTNSNFNADTFASFFPGELGHLMSCTEEIERLRPKSPPPKIKGVASGVQGMSGSGSTGTGSTAGLPGVAGAVGVGVTSGGTAANRGGLPALWGATSGLPMPGSESRVRLPRGVGFGRGAVGGYRGTYRGAFGPR